MVNHNWDVIGHAQVISMLQVESSRPAQTYLFVGPSSVGKATVARHFAAAVLCDGEPDCERRVFAGVHPDLEVVEPDGRTALTVDQARATVARAVLTPVESGRKVFLFEEAGMMNDEAANALLKTLEEPSASTMFLLVAESQDELPATVASRSRTIVFGRVPDGEVVNALTARGVEPDQAERAAVASGGRPGLALMLATRPEVAAFRRAWLSVPTRLEEEPGGAFRLADELIGAADPLLDGLEDRHSEEIERVGDDSRALKVVRERHERERRRATGALHTTGLEILASWYRDAAAAQFGAAVRNRDVPGATLTIVTPAVAMADADRVLQTVRSIESNQRPELAFAALFSDLATPH